MVDAAKQADYIMPAAVEAWLNAVDRRQRLMEELNSTETKLMNAANDLGRWLCPGDAQAGESFCVWCLRHHLPALAREALAFVREQRPKIVCLCGSTRFFAVFAEMNLRETVAGNIVLSIGCDLRSDHQLWADPTDRDRIKANLDRLHLSKIDIADEVIILNVGGYIGDSTRRELAHALSHRKPLRWLEPESADAILRDLRARLGGK